jgi:hypothetical protein
MQATLGFLQHHAPDATSLRALIATLAGRAHDRLRAALRSPGDDLSHLDAHLRRDIGLGEFGAADLAALPLDAVRT